MFFVAFHNYLTSYRKTNNGNVELQTSKQDTKSYYVSKSCWEVH